MFDSDAHDGNVRARINVCIHARRDVNWLRITKFISGLTHRLSSTVV